MRQAPTAIESALKIDVGHAVHTGFFQLTETEVFVVFFFLCYFSHVTGCKQTVLWSEGEMRAAHLLLVRVIEHVTVSLLLFFFSSLRTRDLVFFFFLSFFTMPCRLGSEVKDLFQQEFPSASPRKMLPF